MPLPIPPEFSRRLRIDDLPPSGRTFAAAAGETERRALARRLGLAGLAMLELEGEVSAIRGGTVVRLRAKLAADVTQTCVVTLIPLERHIYVDFVRLYAPGVPAASRLDEEVFFDQEEEDIEPIAGNWIDAGEAAAEQLALELDPYPRAPDAELPFALRAGEHGEAETSHPFAGIAEIAGGRKRKKSK